MNPSEDVPLDSTAEQAAAIVKAALAWRWRQDGDPILNIEGWKLFEAADAYGDQYKGLSARA